MADGEHAVEAGSKAHSGVYQHLNHALRIMKAEPDYRKWGPLIDRLPEEARAEVRDWLFVEAQKARSFQRWRSQHAHEDVPPG